MLTHAPLPAWLDLLRGLTRSPASDIGLSAPWRREGDVAGWLSRSAWSLALIAQWRARRSERGVPITVWLPDFFCNASLQPLRATGARLVFYPVDDEAEPVVKSWKPMLVDGAPEIFVLVHYFGRPVGPVALTAARDLCARMGAWLVEDAAHVLRPRAGIGEGGDFVLYSPHKLLAIPDGAVLVARGGGPATLGEAGLAALGAPAEWAAQLASLASGSDVADTGRTSIVWLAKRVLQSLAMRVPAEAPAPFSEDECGPARLPAPEFSRLGRRLLTVAAPRLWDVARRRQRRQALWDAALAAAPASPVVPAQRAPLGGWTPYLATYRVPADTAAGLFAAWRRQSLPAMTWPDLPPEVLADRDRHVGALRARHERLYLPVHQSVRACDVVARIPAIRRPSSGARVALEWDGVTQQQWQQWLTESGRSSLLQSWSYGTAKAATTRLIARRGVFLDGARPVAIVQALERRLAGLATVTRINRGPLFLCDPAPALRWAVWHAVAELGKLSARRILSVAPELSLDGDALAMLASLGFRQFAPTPAESVIVDLARGPEELKRTMRGSWRKAGRDLDAPERRGLTLETRTDDETFEWMMARYAELMRSNEFSGPPLPLIRSLRGDPAASESVLVLRAIHEDAHVAGICVVVHGATATFLAGWNGPLGRRIGVNPFLFWRACTELQLRGVRWFDLGGISEEHTPGITRFKLDMGGERYELVGEFWKW